jgi:ApbE superfamily uncharacterized protein (UPF0280 family)
MTVNKLLIVAMIAAFSVAGVVPLASVVGSGSAYAATNKVKKKHGYTAQTAGKKKPKMKKTTPKP